MKVEVIEIFNYPPEVIFAVLTDIPHHVDWVNEPLELVSLSDGPAKLGTKWEQNADRLGKKLVTMNTCNIYEKNKKFGWKSERPFPSQVTFLLEPDKNSTKLIWIVESEESGIVQLAEPLLVRRTNEMLRKSMTCLKAYLQEKNKAPPPAIFASLSLPHHDLWTVLQCFCQMCGLDIFTPSQICDGAG
jgi:hypothetical protein